MTSAFGIVKTNIKGQRPALKVSDIAKLEQCHPKLIYELIEAGEIKARKLTEGLRSHIRVDAVDYDDWKKRMRIRKGN